METKALRMQVAAKEAIASLKRALEDSRIEASCYAIRLRVKSEPRLIEKVRRKLETKPDYDLESITDVIGIRLITLFRSDLPSVLTQVINLIKHQTALHPNPIKRNSLEELIIYSTEHESSRFNMRLEELLRKAGITPAIRHSQEGYSSLHLVCRVSTVTVSCSAISANYELPIEIQIRTVFEDAWGEIDHKYGYLARTGKGDANAATQALTGPHLVVLKQFSDACAAYADTIKEMSNTSPSMHSSTGKVLSVESDEDVLHKFHQLSVPEIYIKQYIDGRALRDGCASQGFSKAERIKRYIQASEFFEAILQQARCELTNDAQYLYCYYTQLNSAFCLLSAGTPGSIEKAISIYVQLVQDYPSFPMVRFRLGQAYAKSGKGEDALVIFERTLIEVEEIATKSRDSAMWNDHLPLPDYTHISITLPKLLGYSYWEKAIFRTDPTDIAERLALFKKAYETTLKAHTLKPDDIDLVNNLAFYAMEYLALEANDPYAGALLKILPEFVSRIQDATKQEPGSKDVKMLDTLLQLYILTAEWKQATTLARQIGVALKKTDLGDNNIAQEISKRVISVLTLSNPETS